MSIGVWVRTTKSAARNNSIGVRQESNPQPPTAYSSERVCLESTVKAERMLYKRWKFFVEDKTKAEAE
jgi:hypothetical protein